MKKLLWGALFALVFLAGIFTAIAPSLAEMCCKKRCDHGDHPGKTWREKHKDAEICCRKESCDKR